MAAPHLHGQARRQRQADADPARLQPGVVARRADPRLRHRSRRGGLRGQTDRGRRHEPAHAGRRGCRSSLVSGRAGARLHTAAGSLHVIRADGTGDRTLPIARGMDFLTQPDWSPDGTRIAYAACHCTRERACAPRRPTAATRSASAPAPAPIPTGRRSPRPRSAGIPSRRAATRLRPSRRRPLRRRSASATRRGAWPRYPRAAARCGCATRAEAVYAGTVAQSSRRPARPSAGQ